MEFATPGFVGRMIVPITFSESKAFALSAMGALVNGISWFWIRGVVERADKTLRWWSSAPTVLRYFHRLTRAESGAGRRGIHTALLVTYYASLVWFLLWAAAFVVASWRS